MFFTLHDNDDHKSDRVCSSHCECYHENNSKKHTHCDNDDHEHHHTGISCGCHCCDHEPDEHGNSRYLFWTGIAVLIVAFVLSFFKYSSLISVLYVISYFLIGFDTLRNLIDSFRKKEFFGENTLMTVSSLGAMVIGEMLEGCMVMLLFQFGEMLEHKAVSRSKDNIKKLLDMRPKIAERILADNSTEKVTPENLAVGDIVIVKAGETIPCDGVIIEGCTDADTSSITGESIPRTIEKGDTVRCGYVSLNGLLNVHVSTTYGDNSFSKILKLLSDNSSHKSKSEAFITKFAKIYTPAVMIMSVLIMVVGSIVTRDISAWVYRGMVFLATSCPCALVISVPLAFFFGIGASAKMGLLIKGSEYLEKASRINAIAFDKTGTLTKGKPDIVSVKTLQCKSESELIALCASVEAGSNHPIASRIVSYAENNNIKLFPCSNLTEIPGTGISGIVENKKIECGNNKLVENCDMFDTSEHTTKVFVLADGIPIGVIELADTLKEEVYETVSELRSLGITRVAMLTGDNSGCAKLAADSCGIKEYYSQLEPQDKSAIIDRIISENSGGITAFVGDGINDALVLSKADIGIAVGNTGSDISVETADAVIIGSTLTSLVRGMKCARKVMSRVKFNIIFSISIKVLILILALCGLANMWLAVFGDVGVTLIVILNSLRPIKIKQIG